MSQPNESPRGAALSLREAAAATNVSYSTIKRRQGQFKHAYRDQAGVWRIPVQDLLANGLHLRASSAEPVSQPSESATNGHELDRDRLQAEISMLTAQLADERQRRLVAEAIAAERGASLDRLDLALRAITGPPRAQEADNQPTSVSSAPEPVQAAPAPPEVSENRTPRRGLWARLRGG